MKFYTADTVMWIARIFVVIGLLALCYDTFAHHDSQHRETYIGEFTKIPANVFVCQTQEQAEAMMEAAKEHGGEGYYGSFQLLNQLGVCAQGPALVRVDEVLATYEDTTHNVTLNLVRLTLKSGGEESPPFYSVIVGIKVFQKEDKCVDCKPA